MALIEKIHTHKINTPPIEIVARMHKTQKTRTIQHNQTKRFFVLSIILQWKYKHIKVKIIQIDVMTDD